MEIKYFGETALSHFIDKCKTTFAVLTHTHTAEDIGADAEGSASVALALAEEYTNEQIANRVEQSVFDEHVTNSTNRIDILESKISDLLYEAITFTKFTNNVGTVEKGSTVNTVTLTWATSKAPSTLTLDGSTIDVGLTSHTYTNLALTSNRTFNIKATDERDASATKSTSVSFVNGVYYGAINGGTTIDNAVILGLTRKLQSSKTLAFTTTAGDGQYIIYALPASYGTPSFNVGGFDGGFNLNTTFDFTNASGYTESYNVWLSDNVGLGETTVKVS